LQYNYYHILGVSTTATPQEIKLAYKKLAIQYHPDKHGGNSYFEEKFKAVSEAYQVLSHPQKRATYDLKLYYLLQQKLKQQAAHQQPQYQPPVRRPASVTERHYRTIPQSRFLKKDWYVVIIIFGSIILLSLLLSMVMNHVAAKDKYSSALAALQKKEWPVAHSFLSEAIYFKPKFAEAYMKRAYIEMEIYQDYRAALSDLDATITNASVKTPQMYYLRGKCYEELRNSKVAELDLSYAIQRDKNFSLAYYDRGMIRAASLNKFPEAIQDLTHFLNDKLPNEALRSRALYYRGFCLYLTQQNAAAITDYRQILKHEPQNARVYYLIGKAQLETDSTAAACSNFNKAMSLGYDAAFGDIQEYCAK